MNGSNTDGPDGSYFHDVPGDGSKCCLEDGKCCLGDEYCDERFLSSHHFDPAATGSYNNGTGDYGSSRGPPDIISSFTPTTINKRPAASAYSMVDNTCVSYGKCPPLPSSSPPCIIIILLLLHQMKSLSRELSHHLYQCHLTLDISYCDHSFYPCFLFSSFSIDSFTGRHWLGIPSR